MFVTYQVTQCLQVQSQTILITVLNKKLCPWQFPAVLTGSTLFSITGEPNVYIKEVKCPLGSIITETKVHIQNTKLILMMYYKEEWQRQFNTNKKYLQQKKKVFNWINYVMVNLCPTNIRSVSSSHHIKPVWLMWMMMVMINAAMCFPFFCLPLAPANLHIWLQHHVRLTGGWC